MLLPGNFLQPWFSLVADVSILGSVKMHTVLRQKWRLFLPQHIMKTMTFKRSLCLIASNDRVFDSSIKLQELCHLVLDSVGGLDDLETSLNRFSVPLSSSLVTQVIESCKHDAPARRLLRFFSWSRTNLGFTLDDNAFNSFIKFLAEKKDHTGLQVLISDLRREKRAMYPQTFAIVSETLVKLGREDEASGIFKNLNLFRCPQDGVTVTGLISALCSKGHAKKALAVLHHHRDKVLGNELCIHRSLLHAWSVHENVTEARKVLKGMKSAGIIPDLFCYNTMLSCLCERNLKRNPSGLVPEALNVMMEMRSYKISPNSISYNILLSCLGKTRRVKESCRILEQMKQSGCDPDWTSYYLVTKVLYLTGRFGKGNKMVDEMIERGINPGCRFYYDLIGILCGVERVSFALELFDKMRRSSAGGYGRVYDVLIPKLCRRGDFEKGRELWDEAESIGVTLSCSSDLLDPSITSVFKPKSKPVKVVMVECDVGKIKPVGEKNAKLKHRGKKCKNKKKKRS